MDKTEKLVANVFDKAVTALGLMVNKLSDSINTPKSDEQLLDHFAGLAMCSFLERDKFKSHTGLVDVKVTAEMAYKMAHAMMEQRTKNKI